MKTPKRSYFSLAKFFFTAAVCSAVLSTGIRIQAQPSSDSLVKFWRTDGTVNAIVVTNRTAYIGGDFSYVGPASGAAGLLDADFGDALLGFPKLNGTINAVIPDGAGGWYVGGDFKPAENDKLPNLIHVLRGNTIDSNFKPVPDQPVRTLLLIGGTLLVGGDFSQVAGIQTGSLAFLDPVTGKTNGIRTRVQGQVLTMAAEGDTVYIGGAFRSVLTFTGNQQASVQRGRLAAIKPATGEVTDWNPDSTGGQSVLALAVGANGIYAGGDFTQCGGRPRNAIALLNKTDGAASTWNPNAQLSGGSPSVSAIAVVGNMVYVGGQFTTIGARAKTRLAALQAGGFGQADANWQADANDVVNFIVPSGTDILVGGAFNVIGGRIETVNFQTIQTGGTARGGFARVAQANGAVSDWGPQVSLLRPTVSFGAKAVASAIGMQGSQMLLGGNFISFGGVSRPRLAAINLDTGVPTPWNPSPDLTVRALALGGGGLYVGGLFTNIGGLTRPRIALVKYDTGLADEWDARFAQGQFVSAIAANRSAVYVGGQFNKIGGQDRSSLAQLDVRTGDATEWNPAPSGAVDALLLTEDNLYVAGPFNGIGGNFQLSFLAMLTFDPRPAQILVKTFDAKLDARVRTIALDGAGRLYVGGDFAKISGQDRNRVAAVDAATGVERDPWDAQVTGRGQQQIRAVMPVGQSVYLGGQFSGAGGDNRARVASVHNVFGAATGWDPGADLPINAIARTEDLILIGGEFTRLKMRGPNADQGVGAEPVPYFAAFNARPSIENFGKNAQGRYAFKVLDGDGLGTTLQIQSTDTLTPPAWQTLKTLDVLGIQDPYEDATVAPGGTRIYRLVRQP